MDEASLRKFLGQLGVSTTHKSAKGWINAHCPLAPWTHRKGTDNNPAFAVHVDEGGPSYYACRACHYKGRMSQLVRTMEGFTGRSYGDLALKCDMADASGMFGGGFEAVRMMAEFEEPESIDEAAIRGLYPPAYAVPRAAAYLASRRIGQATSELLELQWDPDDQRILFPVRGKAGELYGFTGRTILTPDQYPRRINYPKVKDYLGLPKRMILLGMNLYQPGKPGFTVEGLFGYASLVEEGLREIVNPLALLGSEMTPQKAHVYSSLDEGQYLMLDNDMAGELGMFGSVDPATGHVKEGAVDLLQRQGIPLFVPEWPERDDGSPKADPDELTYDDVAHIVAHCPLYTG